MYKKNSEKMVYGKEGRSVDAKGYTLIEVMIALAITTIAFIAIYALFARSMQSDTESRYEIVATGLAQEAIEIIKNKREKNEMDWAIWDPASDGPTPINSFAGISGLANCNPELDWVSGYTFSCGIINMQYNKNNLSKKYEAGCTGADCVGPVFERSCETTTVDTDTDGNITELRVSCVVEWNSVLLGGAKRSVKAEILLTDWQR